MPVARYDAMAAFYDETVGDDVSDPSTTALLELAGDVRGLRVLYRLADVTQADALAGQRFDAAVCSQALADIDDLDGALALVARVLPAGGAFCWSLLHPCFPGFGPVTPSSWSVDGYYAERWWLPDSPGFRGRVGSNHRMLSTYLNALRRHGLAVDELREPPPGANLSARQPGAPAVPWFLVARCLRED